MKKALLSVISALLVSVMLLGSFVSCAPKTEDETTGTTSGSSTEQTDKTTDGTTSSESASDASDSTEESESTEESNSESDSDSETEPAELSGEHAQIIEHANSLANGVQAYYTDAGRTHHSIKNQEMTLTFARTITEDQQVASIKNTQGKSYIENTMDVFVRMKDGGTFYASQTASDAGVNVFRFGYYYFQGFYNNLDFVPKNASGNVDNITSVILRDHLTKSKCKNVKITESAEGMTITVMNDNDPQSRFDGFDYSTDNYNMLLITVKAVGDIDQFRAYIDIGEGIIHDHSKAVNLETDGEFHTYALSLADLDSEGVYDGVIKSLRIDPEGGEGSGLVIKDVSFGYSEFAVFPQYLKVNRQFHMYSDKMHHEIQVTALNETTDIEAIGTYTEISKDTVDKILIVDKDEKTYTSLDGIDWSKVTAVAFDIKEAGIFGYIMPYDGKGGQISVTEKDGKYIVVREIAPPDNTIYPSREGSRNQNDFYSGCRVYTDENHDFEEFIFETWCEQNPLIAKNLKVSQAYSDSGEFAGYDSLRGVYVLNVGSPLGGFWEAYNNANRNYKVNFTVSSDKIDREIYVMTSASNGILECAALLDKDMMMLPIPIEVIKNFDDSRNIFNVDDYTFSEAILPLSLKAGEIKEYHFLNLYQNWGKFPLKQISQIPFHVPYYHLSTGVTETNCITPWFATTGASKPQSMLSTLPDHRAWSAPFWTAQPQHTNSGSHHWLEYTDAEGKFYAVECISNIIDSYGPTYAEVAMDNISDDGKIKVEYTHIEMPQTDENRAYYIMEYTVLEDVTINDFKKNFQFFSIAPNDSTGEYQNVSYLDEDNKSAYVKANMDASKELEYKLGDKSPYFTFYEMPGKYDAKTNPQGYSGNGYSNLSFIIYNSNFVLEGKEYEPEFVIINSQHKVRLTLDLGNVTLKAGDKFTINAIVTPWGSQDSVYDGSNGLAPDQNVIDMRENTCLDPLTITSETDEIIESTFVPKVTSKDGKTAEFTLSGCKTSNEKKTEGNNYVTVRAYGFNLLTAPKIEEYVNGKWEEYVVSSKDTPVMEYYHYYDGYAVHYDGDGTYSYSFVVDMTEGEDRKFRIAADTKFEGWPTEVVPETNEDPFLVYFDPLEIKQKFGDKVKSEVLVDGNVSYVSIYPTMGAKELYSKIHNAGAGSTESGQFFAIKYRIPTTNTEDTIAFEVFTSTEESHFAAGHSFDIPVVSDGQWHVAVVDIASIEGFDTFKISGDKYFAKYMRFDVFNKEYFDEKTHVDIAYFGMHASLEDICQINAADFEYITLYENKKPFHLNTVTFEKKADTGFGPGADIDEADLIFFARLDSVSGTSTLAAALSKNKAPTTVKNMGVTSSLELKIAGWCVVDGGVSKYVWSIDGGKTWNDFTGCVDANDTIFNVANNQVLGYSEGAPGFTDKAASIKNGSFQNKNAISIDLSAHEGETLNVILAAVPEAEKDKKVLLYVFESIKVKAESIFVDDSQYTESTALYGGYLDAVNGVTASAPHTGTAHGILKYNDETVLENDNLLKMRGWVIVEGGTSKYVWTADGGKTWHDCGGIRSQGEDAMIRVAQSNAKQEFANAEASKLNAGFQTGKELEIDLSAYKDSTEPLNIYICAVNAANESKVSVLFNVTNVKFAD